MKRFLSALLFFILLPVSVSLSESFTDDHFVGVWFYNSYSNKESYFYADIIVIRQNHKAFITKAKLYDDQGQNKYDQYICTWKSDGNKITIKHVGSVYHELYLFDDRYLSFDNDGRHKSYVPVPETLLIPLSEAETIPIETTVVNISVNSQDLSSLSYDELVKLKDQINLAMWNTEEWQEVTVPIGVWTVGEDIPVGHWSISLSPESSSKWASIKYCDLLNAAGTDAGNRFYCDIYAYLNVGAKSNDSYPQTIDIDCKPGTYIIIDHGSVVFTPYSGKPDLGFKK